MMILTYFAVKPQKVGDDVREPGELIPEARDWAFLPGYITNGEIAPVLVATLPEETQQMLADWEAEQDALRNTVLPETPPAGPEPDGDDQEDGDEAGDEAPDEDPDLTAVVPEVKPGRKARRTEKQKEAV